MTRLLQNSAVTADPVLMTVHDRLGILGLGRLVTILSVSGPAGASMGYIEWLGLLQASPAEWDLLVTVLRELEVFTTHATDHPARIRFEPGPAWAPVWDAKPAHLTLMPNAAAWAAWCESELAMPGWLQSDPHTQALFRRWCASHVTVGEATEAVLLATAAGDLSPATLHHHLASLRKQALHKANQ